MPSCFLVEFGKPRKRHLVHISAMIMYRSTRLGVKVKRQRHCCHHATAPLVAEFLLLLMMTGADQHGMRQGSRPWWHVRCCRCDEMVPRTGTCRVRTTPVTVRRRRRRPRRRRTAAPGQVVHVGTEVQQTESTFQAPVKATRTQSLVKTAQYENALQWKYTTAISPRK